MLSSLHPERGAAEVLRLSIYFAAKQPLMMGFAVDAFLRCLSDFALFFIPWLNFTLPQ